jgi:hypothetical protein
VLKLLSVDILQGAHGHKGIAAQVRRDLTRGSESEGAEQLPNQLAAFSLDIHMYILLETYV